MEIERDKLLATLKRAQDPRGLRMHELADELGADARGRHRVRTLLGELLTEGTIEKAEGPRYRLVDWRPTPVARPGAKTNGGSAPAPGKAKAKAEAKPGAVTGTIRVHPAGYGFVIRDDGEEDVFVAARNRGAALDGDQVELDIWVGYKGTEGRVMDVLRRGRARVTGILRVAGRTPYLEPDDPRVRGHVSLADGTGGAHEGQVVVAEIVSYPTRPDEPLGARVERVLGEPDDPRTEVAKVIACAEIPDEFPSEVLEAAARVPREVVPGDLLDRVDLRDRAFLTIDPEVARDFDDAVCVEDGPGEPGRIDRLWVAVADVSHYVRPGSAIDLEARIRGVSVYLPDRAIPMLPPALSSGICSLNPDVDRLAMVARLDVDEAGVIRDTQFAAAVIRSRARLDYHGVAAALGGDLRGPRARYREHLPQLERLDRVARRMRAVRRERGALDFDLPEAVVVLDEDDPRRVREVKKSRALPEVRDAYRLVEDCMLAANEAVAQKFIARRRDTLWRVHDVPKEERLLDFVQLAETLGAALSVDACRTPRQLRDFLESIAGLPMARSLSYLLLRTLKQAVYDVVNVGHFGLASPAYLHFTSPIRRYPDLVVHRLLKQLLRREGMPAGGGEVVAGPVPQREELARWASDSSAYERRAMEAEREVVDMYRAYLMRDRIGEEYDGVIVGVTNFGLFVEIPEPFVEGLIKVDTLGGDAWVYDEQKLRLVGRSSGRSFALGDAVRVRIENVSVARRKIDFVLIGHEAAAAVPAQPQGRRRPSREASPGRKGADGKDRKQRSRAEERGAGARRGRRR